MGGGWRMPTLEEWQEFYANVSGTPSSNEVTYSRVTYKSNLNSKTIIFPTMGHWSDYYYEDQYEWLSNMYWSSTLQYNANNMIANAWEITSPQRQVTAYRNYGLPIRAVLPK